jgi:hypothetical protein
MVFMSLTVSQARACARVGGVREGCRVGVCNRNMSFAVVIRLVVGERGNLDLILDRCGNLFSAASRLPLGPTLL